MKKIITFLNQKLTTAQTILPLFVFVLMVSTLINEGFLNFNESNKRVIEGITLSTNTPIINIPVNISTDTIKDIVPEVTKKDEPSELSALGTIVPIVVSMEPPKTISTVEELDTVVAGTVFFTPEGKSDFYEVSKMLIEEGRVLHLNFDLIKGVESIGTFGLYYLASVLIAEDAECSQIIPTANGIEENKELSPTPLLDSMSGICAVISMALSFNYVLDVPVPNDYPNPTYSYGDSTEYWDPLYFESLVKNSGVTNIENGLYASDEYTFYKKYITSAKKVVQKIWFKTDGYTKKEWEKIVTTYEKGDTDCSLDTGSHLSHILNIYSENNKKYIQIADTLEQGDSQHINIPVKPSTTTFLVKKNGSLEAVSHEGANEWTKSYWEKEENTSSFQINCYTPVY